MGMEWKEEKGFKLFGDIGQSSSLWELLLWKTVVKVNLTSALMKHYRYSDEYP